MVIILFDTPPSLPRPPLSTRYTAFCNWQILCSLHCCNFWADFFFTKKARYILNVLIPMAKFHCRLLRGSHWRNGKFQNFGLSLYFSIKDLSSSIDVALKKTLWETNAFWGIYLLRFCRWKCRLCPLDACSFQQVKDDLSILV